MFTKMLYVVEKKKTYKVRPHGQQLACQLAE
jgi:hypothetical protein